MHVQTPSTLSVVLSKAGEVEDQARALAIRLDEDSIKQKMKELETGFGRKKQLEWADAKNPKNKLAKRAFEQINQIRLKRINK